MEQPNVNELKMICPKCGEDCKILNIGQDLEKKEAIPRTVYPVLWLNGECKSCDSYFNSRYEFILTSIY